MDVADVIRTLVESDERSVGKYVNKVADEFRRGADLRDLLPLITHSDARFVSVGAWIASEVVVGTRGREIFEELTDLLLHKDPVVRFEAIKSVSQLVQPDDQIAIGSLIRLSIDDDAGVRRQALTHICLIPNSVVQGIRNTTDWASVQLLVRGVSKDRIRSAIRSDRLFDQRMAVAGAMRNYGNDTAFLDELSPYFDNEVTEKLETLPREGCSF